MDLNQEHTVNMEFVLKSQSNFIYIFLQGYEMIVFSGRTYKHKKSSTGSG